MPKDTKSLDNHKAPACESRGFVHKKKEGVHFDTPSFLSPNLACEVISLRLFEPQAYELGQP